MIRRYLQPVRDTLALVAVALAVLLLLEFRSIHADLSRLQRSAHVNGLALRRAPDGGCVANVDSYEWTTWFATPLEPLGAATAGGIKLTSPEQGDAAATWTHMQ